MEAGGDEDGVEELSVAGAQEITAPFLQLEASVPQLSSPCGGRLRRGSSGVAAARRAKLPVGVTAARRACRPARTLSHGAGGAARRARRSMSALAHGGVDAVGGTRPPGLVPGGCAARRAPRAEAVEQPPLAMVPGEQQLQHRPRTVAQQQQQSMNGHKGWIPIQVICLKFTFLAIQRKYPPGYLEVPHAQYYDAELKTFPKVTSDQELMVMFNKHKEKVIEMFIAYCDPSEPYKSITEWQFEGEAQHKDDTKQELDTYLMNPLLNNEHVGVDEEGMYLKEDRVLAVPSDKGKEKTSVSLSEDKAQSGSKQEVTENEMTKDEMKKDSNHGPHVEYDKEDSPMTAGSMYPNMAEFKLALSQHAIKNEFEYNTERSGPKRLRAYCSRKEANNFPWRIHASTTVDRITIMVKKNPSAHCCSSSIRKKRVRNATRHWICEKVKDWLIQDATLGAIAFQEKLKEHYKVTIHYKRVFDAYSWNSYLFEKHWAVMEAASQTLGTTTKKSPIKKITSKKKRKKPDSISGPSKSSNCQSIEITSKKNDKHGNSSSRASKRSRSGSNQPEPISTEFHSPTKEKAKRTKKQLASNLEKFLCCHLTALQWAPETKQLSLLVLQIAQEARES